MGGALRAAARALYRSRRARARHGPRAARPRHHQTDHRSRPERARSARHRRARRVGPLLRRRRILTSPSAAAARPKSSSPSSAAPRSSSSDRGTVMLAEGERSLVKDGGAPAAAGAYAADAAETSRSRQEADEDARDGETRRALRSDARSRSLPAQLRGRRVRRHVVSADRALRLRDGPQSERHVDVGPVVRLRLVSARPLGLASVLSRPVASRAALRLDLDRRRALGVADASLRTVGLPSGARLLLDSRAQMGRGVGLVGVAPNYVGWCPLGWDGRPVFGFASFGTTAVVARGYDPWRGWTVVNSGRFGRGYDVRRHRVDHRVIVRERPAFVTAWGPPRRAGIGGDVIVRGEARDGRGVAPPRHGYADPRNVYGSRDGSSRRSGVGQPHRRSRHHRAAQQQRGAGRITVRSRAARDEPPRRQRNRAERRRAPA